jgi:hypothetical protein
MNQDKGNGTKEMGQRNGTKERDKGMGTKEWDKGMGPKESDSPAPILLPSLRLAERLNLK